MSNFDFTPEYLKQLRHNMGYYPPQEQLKMHLDSAQRESVKEIELQRFNTDVFKKLFNDFRRNVLLNPSLQKSPLRGHDGLYHFAYILICKTKNRFLIGRENSKIAFRPNNKTNKINCMSKQIKDDHEQFGSNDFDFELISYFPSEEALTEWINATFNDDFKEKFIKTNMAYNTMLQFNVKEKPMTDATTTIKAEEKPSSFSNFAFSLVGDYFVMRNNDKWELVPEGFKSIILSHPEMKSIVKRYDFVEFLNLIADKK